MADDKKADKKEESMVKEVEVDGFKFEVDTDLLDDVETFEMVDRVENKGQVAAIVPLLQLILGDETYSKMKEHFTDLDAKEHKDKKNYKPRFRLGKLQEVYLAIIEKFDPKG